MSGDIGRGFAILLAIVLCVTGPLLVMTGRSGDSKKYAVQQILDEFATRVELNKAVTLGDYEKMLSGLAAADVIFDVEMYIGKKTVIDVALDHPNLLFCENHVHTPTCYLGHNHTASRCEYHIHSSDCYCSGKMTRHYKTDYYDFFCHSCNGTGQISHDEICSACNGEKGEEYTARCSCRTGKIMEVEDCGKCGGTGKRSNGKTCSTCGGTGNVGVYVTHEYCGGTGYVTGWARCSTCHGTGIEQIIETCEYCRGEGSAYRTINYYCCEICGQGSTTSYGTVCGIKKCEYDREGYVCGINENDMSPLCNRIIVDADYKREQVLKAGQGLRDIDNNITFIYLDGSRDIQSCEIEDIANISFDHAGEYYVRLGHTGMYLNPGEEEKKYFAVKVIINGNKDKELLGIRAVNKQQEYVEGDSLNVEVFAVYEDEERLLDADEYWNTFNSDMIGEQTVFIGYSGFMTEIDAVVVKDERTNAEEGTGENASTEEDPEGNEKTEDSKANENSEANDGSKEDGFPEGTEDNPNESGTGRKDGDDPEDAEDTIPDRNITEEILRAGYEEMLSTEEVLDTLYSSGRIDLEEGDGFSISVTVTDEQFASWFGLFEKKGKEKYTSGTVIV